MQFENGDILAFYGGDIGSRAISAVTCWPVGPRELWFPPSHVGIIVKDYTLQEDRQKVHVNPVVHLFESTTACRHRCQISNKVVTGWQAHNPEQRIDDYLSGGGSVDVYRLNHPVQNAAEKLRHAAMALGHAQYDYLGAGLSGTKLWQLLGLLFPRPNLDSLFCSEFLAAVLMRAGLMNWDNPTRYNPGRLMRTLVWTGVYTRVETITPSRESATCAASWWPGWSWLSPALPNLASPSSVAA